MQCDVTTEKVVKKLDFSDFRKKNFEKMTLKWVNLTHFWVIFWNFFFRKSEKSNFLTTFSVVTSHCIILSQKFSRSELKWFLKRFKNRFFTTVSPKKNKNENLVTSSAQLTAPEKKF